MGTSARFLRRDSPKDIETEATARPNCQDWGKPNANRSPSPRFKTLGISENMCIYMYICIVHNYIYNMIYILLYIILYIYIIYIHMSLLGMVSNLHEFLGRWIRFLKPMMKSGCLVEISMDWIPMVISPEKLLALQWFVGLNLSCKIMKQVLVASKKNDFQKESESS